MKESHQITSDNLELQLESWHRKCGLRAVYRDWFEEVRTWLVMGTSYDIGCGIGRLKEYLRDMITIDVINTLWIDIVCDAQLLPLKNESAANMILFDVLHHVPRPVRFFEEALRVLNKGGRIIIVEP